MKYRLLLLVVCIGFSGVHVSAIAQRQKASNRAETKWRKCAPNPDPLYHRSRVLNELADILNQSIPEYSKGMPKGFYTEFESGIGFFVFDLTNPANKELTLNDCVDFINGHVYHVAPPDAHYSLSHIVILEEGKLKVFRSVNCPARGDKLEDAIKYVSDKLAGDKKRDQIIERLRNYEKYGDYFKLNHAALGLTDRAAFICKYGKPIRE